MANINQNADIKIRTPICSCLVIAVNKTESAQITQSDINSIIKRLSDLIFFLFEFINSLPNSFIHEPVQFGGVLNRLSLWYKLNPEVQRSG